MLLLLIAFVVRMTVTQTTQYGKESQSARQTKHPSKQDGTSLVNEHALVAVAVAVAVADDYRRRSCKNSVTGEWPLS
jgi:Na+-transporting methylmalonyl-CoA/oxaloacetate decarboxylase gamma subunit